jgi:hypothetical protein
MHMPPDEPNDEEELEKEPEDYDTPFRPADDIDEDVIDPDADEEWPTESEESSIPSSDKGALDSTYPQTDTNMIAAEWYDEGIPGAAGSQVGEPNTGDAVIGYHGVETGPNAPEEDMPDGFHAEDEDRAA